jgi:putative ATP-dependent endonuclease of OLD family
MKYFKIPTVALYDGDVKSKRGSDNGINFFTSDRCFELDIIRNLYSKKQIDIIKKIALEMNNKAESLVLDTDFVRKGFNYMKLSTDGYIPKKLVDVDETNEDEFIRMYGFGL